MREQSASPIEKLAYERATLVPKGMDGASTRKALQAVYVALSAVPTDAFDAGNLADVVASRIEESGIAANALLSTLRVAITGSLQPADIYEAMELLGKEGTTRRLEHAIQELMVVA
jgi:glutamyl/glutaminyl-tRNA synthetase